MSKVNIAEFNKLIGKLTDSVTAEAYFASEKKNASGSMPDMPKNSPAQVLPSSPPVKASLDPSASVDINAILETASMFLDFVNNERAISYFEQILDKDPRNTYAIEGLERAKQKQSQ